MKSTGNDIVALNAIDIQRTNTPAFYLKIITISEQSLYNDPEVAAMPFENFVWLLWSVKESVYKYLKRANPKLIFSPTKITVQSIRPPVNLAATEFNRIWESDGSTDDFFCGEVIFEDYRLYFCSKISANFIGTIVNHSPNFDGVYWGVKLIDSADSVNQSKQVREFALQKLNSVLEDLSPQGLSAEDPEAGTSCYHPQGPFQETLRGRNPGSLKDGITIEKNEDGCPIFVNNGKQTNVSISLAHHDKFVSYSFVI